MPSTPVDRTRDARRLLPAARGVLEAYPNVVGVGVGLRHRAGTHTEEVCFIVSVSRKRTLSARDMLPQELFGIPVDVQQDAPAKLMAGVSSGEMCRTVSGPSGLYGRLGVVASQPNNKHCVLTVLHVLLDLDGPVSLLPDGRDYAAVEARVHEQSTYAAIGKLREGYFSLSSDIARVALDDSTIPRSGLIGSSEKLTEPTDLTRVPLHQPVYLRAQNALVKGRLVQSPCPPTMINLDGNAFALHDLAAFEISDGEVEGGWSGSAIIIDNGSHSPLALLTCAKTVPGGRQLVYGFNLTPWWSLWNLQSVVG